ncbi:MAG: DUF1254 domain-containing protein [Eudoraea sp.]|uniref:DUF1254 domain-containing protein n=1 Tax=Eudoraea sp. TaxID=1979955 RepID=UPI003C71960E
MKLKSIAFFVASLLVLFSCNESKGPQLTVKEYKDLGYSAYIYGYPMLAQLGQLNAFLDDGTLVKNKIQVITGFSKEDTPENFMTASLLPNTAGIFIDVSEGPVIIDIPRVKDRYIVYQCIDIFTHNIYYLGTRADFGYGGRFVFYKEGQGLPNDQSIQAILIEGNQAVMLMGFKQTKASEISVLNNYLEKVKIVYAPNEISIYPSYDENKVFSPDFVSYINQLVDSIPETERDLYEGFKAIGIKDSVKLTTAQTSAIQMGIDSAMTVIKDAGKKMQSGNGYISSRGFYGSKNFFKDDYLKRAIGAYTQLWSNSQEESIWFKTQAKGSGKISFNKEELPPLKDNGFITVQVTDQNKQLIGTSLLLSQEDLSETKPMDLLFSTETQPGKWLYTPEGEYTIVIQVFLPELPAFLNYSPPKFEAGL